MQRHLETRLGRLELDASAAARTHTVFLKDGMNREAEQRALAASDRWSPGDTLIFVTWQNWREGPDSPAATDDARPI
jgi:hypothetical protein